MSKRWLDEANWLDDFESDAQDPNTRSVTISVAAARELAGEMRHLRRIDAALEKFFRWYLQDSEYVKSWAAGLSDSHPITQLRRAWKSGEASDSDPASKGDRAT